MSTVRFCLFAAVAAAVFYFWNQSSSSGAEPPFLKDYQAALNEGRKTGKPVLLVFSASWCPPCQSNKKAVYPSKEVKPYHDKFIWAYLDAEEGPNRQAMAQYQVKSIPHIQFLTSSGKPLDQMIGGTSAQAFATKLAAVLAKSRLAADG